MLVVYTKNNCPACVALKARLAYNNIAYIAINIDEDSEAKQFLIAQGHRSVPQMYRDGVVVKDVQ